MTFVCVTMEGWTEMMYWVFDAYHWLTCIYFIGIIWIGSFFLLNLTLAVIKAQFSATAEKDDDDVDAEEREVKVEVWKIKAIREPDRIIKKK